MSSGELPPGSFGENRTERDELMLPRPLYQVKFGLGEWRLPPEIEAILHDRDIRYGIIPIADMWLGSPIFYRVERDENDTYTTREVARGFASTIRKLQSDEFCETLLEESEYEDVLNE